MTHSKIYIRDLKEEDKLLIKEALQEDSFGPVKISLNRISFKEGYRGYELISTNIFGDDEIIEDESDGLIMDIDLLRFLKDNYYMKTKYCKSLNERLSQKKDIEAACESMGWEVVETKTMNEKEWYLELPIDMIVSVHIKGKPHLVLDMALEDGDSEAMVLEGDMANLWGMISTRKKILFPNGKYSFVEVLENISNKYKKNIQ